MAATVDIVRPAPAEQAHGAPLISVCILAGHGTEALRACLHSLAAQVSPPPFELLVGEAGGGAARSVVQRSFPSAQILSNGDRLPGAARNQLVDRARGELLLFLDDDTTATPTLLSDLARTAAEYPDATVFGGPNKTPRHSSRFQTVQGAVLSSLVATGPVARRYGARHPGPADERWFTLCNLAVRRSVMRRFPDDLVCAEENAVLSELERTDQSMRYDPRLAVTHERRPTPRAFARQMFKYGWGRGSLIRRDPQTIRAAYLAPVGLLVYLLSLPTLWALDVIEPWMLAPGALYAAIVVAGALRIGWTLRKRPAAAPMAIGLILVVHLCYGSGILRGLAPIGRSDGPLDLG